MDTTSMIQLIDKEIARLERAKALLSGHTGTSKEWKANHLNRYCQVSSRED
jgi:hypothetical protein